MAKTKKLAPEAKIKAEYVKRIKKGLKLIDKIMKGPIKRVLAKAFKGEIVMFGWILFRTKTYPDGEMGIVTYKDDDFLDEEAFSYNIIFKIPPDYRKNIWIEFDSEEIDELYEVFTYLKSKKKTDKQIIDLMGKKNEDAIISVIMKSIRK